MSDALLEAVQALRETTSGEELANGRYTRSRVLAAVRLQKRRRVLNVAFGIPMAAILIGSGAWAASGQRIPLFVQRVSIVLGWRQPPAVSAPLALRRDAASRISARSAALSEQAVVSDVPAVACAVSAEQAPQSTVPSQMASTAVAASAKPIAALPRDSRVTEQELLLYERAHRAHFVDRNAGVALAAWEQYLRDVPRGRFAVEARYNRALCLVRLGRIVDAEEALEPFARGAFGGYRSTEARTLIEQLASPTP